MASAAIPALVAGDLDAVQMSAVPVLTASLRGHDVVFVAGLLNTMIWTFYVKPEIQRPEELRGKVIGTDKPATPVAYGTLVALKKLGLSPRDLQLYPIGGSEQILAAFLSGRLAGGIAGPPQGFQLERAGFRALVSLLDVPYQNVGIVIKRSRADELGDRLVPFLRGLRAGMGRYARDKEFAVRVIAKYSKEGNPDVLDRTYDFYRQAGFNQELTISGKGIQEILNFLRETMPEAQQATPSQFFDDRFVRRVKTGS
jgi:ABC-type nitrate/sulfonate/bicarbonate transport system substrate-binding protein